MVVDVLMHKMHERKHDLESFYWLLVWTLLRHSDHDQGPSACSKLFDVEDRELAAAQKRTWLEAGHVVPDRDRIFVLVSGSMDNFVDHRPIVTGKVRAWLKYRLDKLFDQERSSCSSPLRNRSS